MSHMPAREALRNTELTQLRHLSTEPGDGYNDHKRPFGPTLNAGGARLVPVSSKADEVFAGSD